MNIECKDRLTSCHGVDVYCGKKFDCSCKVTFDDSFVQECDGQCGTKTCDNKGSSGSSSNSTGPIIGIVIAVIVICLIAFCIYRRRKNKQNKQNNQMGYYQQQQPQQRTQYNGTNQYYGNAPIQQNNQRYNM